MTINGTSSFGMVLNSQQWGILGFSESNEIDRILQGSNDAWRAFKLDHDDILLIDMSPGRNENTGMTGVCFVGQSGKGETVVLAAGLLKTPSAASFKWLFEKFKAQYIRFGIPFPQCVFSSSYPECLETVETSFPNSQMRLWLKEINRSILQVCKPMVTDSERVINDQIDESTLTADEIAWMSILFAWIEILEADSKGEFNSKWEEFRATYRKDHRKVVKYLKKHWIKPHKRLLTGLWIDNKDNKENKRYTQKAYMEGAGPFLSNAMKQANLPDMFTAIRAAFGDDHTLGAPVTNGRRRSARLEVEEKYKQQELRKAQEAWYAQEMEEVREHELQEAKRKRQENKLKKKLEKREQVEEARAELERIEQERVEARKKEYDRKRRVLERKRLEMKNKVIVIANNKGNPYHEEFAGHFSTRTIRSMKKRAEEVLNELHTIQKDNEWEEEVVEVSSEEVEEEEEEVEEEEAEEEEEEEVEEEEADEEEEEVEDEEEVEEEVEEVEEVEEPQAVEEEEEVKVPDSPIMTPAKEPEVQASPKRGWSQIFGSQEPQEPATPEKSIKKTKRKAKTTSKEETPRKKARLSLGQRLLGFLPTGNK